MTKLRATTMAIVLAALGVVLLCWMILDASAAPPLQMTSPLPTATPWSRILYRLPVEEPTATPTRLPLLRSLWHPHRRPLRPFWCVWAGWLPGCQN